MTNKPLSHSFSSIKMFENCPLQYYEVRIKKSFAVQGGEATVWGERVHKHLEDYGKSGVAPPPESATYAAIVDGIKKVTGDGTVTFEESATLNKELQPTGWFSADAWLRSKLDVKIVRGPYAYVFDYKTGKRRPDWTQLELFSLQVFAHHPEVDSVGTKFIWLKDATTDTATYKRKEAPVLWEKLLERIHRIEAAEKAGVWPAKPSGLCPWCPVMTCKARSSARR